MATLKIKKGDTVYVLAGDDKGKTGRVLNILREQGKAIVEGVNIVSKSTKPNAKAPQGGIIKKEAPIHLSNLAVVDPKSNYAIIKLPSGETRKVIASCKATVGVVGNSDHALEQSGKAGRSRWLGRRPHNRGVVMNPVDHPMGGGEGRQSGGHPRNRNGLYAKGLKTRAPKKQSSKYIIERRKK